ncbi:MAG: GNAT family N-acetyltransferase [Clostridia bacterium]|nr:GNAT family N-acetyltransferase [Clostridia bacterium]
MSNLIETKECISQEEKHEVWQILNLVYDEITIPNYEEYKEKVCKYAQIVKAVYNDTIVGFVAFYANNLETKQAYITQIAVLKDYQKMHIGSELLNTCLKIAKKAGMETCRLEVNNCNVNAITFYKKKGFTPDGDASKDSKYMLLREI